MGHQTAAQTCAHARSCKGFQKCPHYVFKQNAMVPRCQCGTGLVFPVMEGRADRANNLGASRTTLAIVMLAVHFQRTTLR